jgi:hypothetical protein
VSKKFGDWHQKTNKTEDTNKLTLLTFKIIDILHNTLLATFIKLLETLGIDRRTAVTRSWIAATSAKRAPFMMRFETYEPFISLIFNFFRDTESVDTGARLCFVSWGQKRKDMGDSPTLSEEWERSVI